MWNKSVGLVKKKNLTLHWSQAKLSAWSMGEEKNIFLSLIPILPTLSSSISNSSLSFALIILSLLPLSRLPTRAWLVSGSRTPLLGTTTIGTVMVFFALPGATATASSSVVFLSPMQRPSDSTNTKGSPLVPPSPLLYSHVP